MGRIFDGYQKIREGALGRLAEKEKGVHCVIRVGSATCENAAGAEAVRNEFAKLIRASGRKDILIEQTGCSGRCAREPIVGILVKGQIPYKYERVTPDKVQQIFHDHILGGEPVTPLVLDKKTSNIYTHTVLFCGGYCSPDGITKWEEAFRELLGKHGIDPVTIKLYSGGCLGQCAADKSGRGVRFMVMPDNVTYEIGSREDLEAVVKSHFVDKKVFESLKVELDEMTEKFLSTYGDVAFFNKQTRITLRNSGIIDPESLDDYLRNRGYEALAKVLDGGDPDAVIKEIEKSGLRGRGGGGYPTGLKWAAALNNDDPVRYIICNADEGDPGAFMDRSTLEGDPFSVIEGMAIGAYAIRAVKGFIYLRAEYPLAIKRCRTAIEKAREAGLLGNGILGSGFDFDIEIRLGAGAYVCGEETALIRSIEGQRGQPVIRPPYPTESGLWGHPTVINNVETFANVPVIIMYGADWFSRIGTKGSKGTKVFALAGKVNNTGLVEVPMGTTIRDIVYDIGGGIPGGRALKAVQTGGPSGGCIPADSLDLLVDYESLNAAGSIMGSGGMIVLDDQDCMVATAKYFLEFTKSESCGKCVPCREGTVRMLEILQRITDGEGAPGDLEKLERLGNLIKKTSLCGLGQNAPNPVLSMMHSFRDEFNAHIEQKRCPSHRCAKLIRYEIDRDKCVGCTLCARRCPVQCISGDPKKPHTIDQSRCIRCGECFKACKFDAVTRS